MTASASLAGLTEALLRLLELDFTLQDYVVKHVAAVACPAEVPPADAAVPPPPLWTHPCGHPPYPHSIHYESPNTESEHRRHQQNFQSVVPPVTVELLLTLDVFTVAQLSPLSCYALLRTPCTAVDASATAAVQEWVRRHVKRQREMWDGAAAVNTRNIVNDTDNDDRAVERAPSVGPLPCPPWWAAVEEGGVEYSVRVLLLRIPSFYSALTSGASFDSDTSARQLPLPDCCRATVSTLLRGSVSTTHSSLLSDLTTISPLSSEARNLPSAPTSTNTTNTTSSTSPRTKLSLTLSEPATAAYPFDGYLELAHVVHVVGVVHQVYFESKSATCPAPWVTLSLLLLPPPSSSSSSPSSAASAPVMHREVSLESLAPSVARAVAVLGTVVEVRGHTQVARRPANARGGFTRGPAEPLLQEYVVASWASVALDSGGPVAPLPAPDPNVDSPCTLLQLFLPPPSPVVSTAAFSNAPFDPRLQRGLPADAHGRACPPEMRSSAEEAWRVQDSSGVAEGNSQDACVGELSGWEEENAARVALTCWEGARLAMGMEADEEGMAEDESDWATEGCGDLRACTATAYFSTTLDAVLAAQLALYSAHLRDGVVALFVDEAPDSFLTQLLAALRRAAPTATLECPPSIACRAQPSYFLPSYAVQRVPAASRLARPPPVSSGTSPTADDARAMPPPTPRRPRTSAALTSAAAVAGPPPPFFAEVLRGGALTLASGRALVLQGIEAVPAATLKVLQDALRTASHSDGPENTSACIPQRDEQQCAVSASVAGNIGDFAEMRSGFCYDAAAAQRHVVQREGGQFVRYRVAHAALCSVRHGARLAEKSYLFEFAQRCDVVVRPAYDRRRQVAALEACLHGTFQRLLCSRRDAWLATVGGALKLSTNLCDGNTDADDDGQSAERMPTLTEACNSLLSSYFIAAKALCADATDASMMTTLVKLTLTHAQWRTALTRTHPTKSFGRHSGVSAAAATALIDAVVAVALCDATLHFFTAKTLLGECVLNMLEREAWPVWEAEAAAEDWSRLAPNPDAVAEVDGDLPLELQPFYKQVEYRTRWPTNGSDAGSSRLSAFSIQQLVHDLLDHLARLTQSAAPAGN